MALAEYRRKRNFKATPEPSGGGTRDGMRTFVVQLHHASHRHYDFRLEIGGVLKSWAVPKGPSFDPAVKRMAMEVEDHPLSYASFEGDIPEGNYGAGHVDIFDEGTWTPDNDLHEGLRKGELRFTMHGDVLRGGWILTRMRKEKGRQPWLLIKQRDDYAGEREADDFVNPRTDRPIARSARRKVWPKEPKPTSASAKPRARALLRETLTFEPFTPELCRSQERPPGGAGWLHEAKWDGYRILATVVGRKVALWSRNGLDWTDRLTDVAAAVKGLGVKSAQLDGELVVIQDGHANFNALQARLSGESKEPLHYLLFDLPHLDGKSLRDAPLADRKERLRALLDANPHDLLGFSEHQVGDGAEVFAQAIEAGIEGIVSKRVDSRYTGARSGAWVKVKARPSDEFVVIGYTPPKGSRAGIGALLLAKPDKDGWRYVGRVGTGLDNALLSDLLKKLKRIHTPDTDADLSLLVKKDIRTAQWVKPALVVEVFFQGIGGQGLLRQPAWKTLREDKTPADLRGAAAPKSRPARKAATQTSAKKTGEPSSIKLTNPDRVVFAELGITKAEVGAYYEAVAPLLIPELAGRPVSVVRCPDGASGKCFFQKHVTRGWGDHIHGVDVQEKHGKRKYLCIDEVAGLLELVQMNVLELHPWGAKSSDLTRADRLVLDLDPHPTVGWPAVVAAARDVRKQLTSIGLCSFLRTSGGKGLHVVVPLDPPCPWDELKRFAQAVSAAMTTLRPDRYVDKAGEKNRVGKIFIDWLRNGHGATAVASYSLRARPAAGVAMPVAWKDLGRVRSGDAFTLQNALEHLRRRKVDPWAEIHEVQQTLPA